MQDLLIDYVVDNSCVAEILVLTFPVGWLFFFASNLYTNLAKHE